MPTAPPRMCDRCRRTFTGRRCPCRKAWEGSSWQGKGSTRAWRTRRRRQLEDYPLCQAPGCRELATVADHVEHMAGGGRMEGRLQSLCTAHHDAKTQAEARRGRGLD